MVKGIAWNCGSRDEGQQSVWTALAFHDASSCCKARLRPSLSGQILRWNRSGGRLSIPEDGDDPISIAVLEQLDGIDAALEGFAIFGVA
jgi:hypothetical protein